MLYSEEKKSLKKDKLCVTFKIQLILQRIALYNHLPSNSKYLTTGYDAIRMRKKENIVICTNSIYYPEYSLI